MSKRKDTLIEGIAMAVGLVVLIVGAALVRTHVPCAALGWLPAGEVPARCLMEGK